MTEWKPDRLKQNEEEGCASTAKSWKAHTHTHTHTHTHIGHVHERTHSAHRVHFCAALVLLKPTVCMSISEPRSCLRTIRYCAHRHQQGLTHPSTGNICDKQLFPGWVTSTEDPSRLSLASGSANWSLKSGVAPGQCMLCVVHAVCSCVCVCAHVYKLWMARTAGEWPHRLQLPGRAARLSQAEAIAIRASPRDTDRWPDERVGGMSAILRQKKDESENNGTAGKSTQSQSNTWCEKLRY